MKIAPLDSQEELATLRALVAEQAVSLDEKRAALVAEIEKRDDIIRILKAQLDLRRHSQHGASSEKIDRKIEQYELMLEEIESARAEAAVRAGKDPLPELDDGKDKPKRKPLPDNLPTEERVVKGGAKVGHVAAQK